MLGSTSLLVLVVPSRTSHSSPMDTTQQTGIVIVFVCVRGWGVGMREMHNTSSYMYGINLLFATYIIELLNFKNIVI